MKMDNVALIAALVAVFMAVFVAIISIRSQAPKDQDTKDK
jgi:hypothetical protein